MIKFSAGYAERLAERIGATRDALSERARLVAGVLAEDFAKCSDPQQIKDDHRQDR